MRIEREIDKTQWNEFVAANSSPASFLQTYEWGEFQKSLGLKVHQVTVVDDRGEYQACAQAIVRPMPFGKTYLEAAKGPIEDHLIADSRIADSLMQELIKIAEDENAILLRINPPYDEFNLKAISYKLKAPEILLRQTEPNDTVLVDLTKSEDELLSAMHEKSRYNIRLAIKKGVTVTEKTGDRDAFEKFLELIEETAKRDHITVWPRERFEKFRETFMTHNSPPDFAKATTGRQPSLSLREGVPPLKVRGGEGELLNSPRAILLSGEFEGKILAAAIIMLFGDAGTYLYAASSAEQRNANVPSLVLWEAIRAAKRAGKKYYDMWGIAPSGASESHSWTGITRFKTRYVSLGQTGLEKHYLGTRDLILDKKYYTLFKLGKTLRRILKK